MSMLPEVHLNFGQITFERIYQIFLPLVPGATLVGGLLLAHPQGFHDAQAILGLGRYSRIAVIVGGVYVAGLILYGFSLSVTGNTSIFLTGTIYKRWPPKRQNEGPSQAWVWRRVAHEFLGQSLSPQPANPPAPPFGGNDVEWQDLYNILQDYVLRGVAVISDEFILLMTYLQATAWALFYLYWRTDLRAHWSVAVVSLTIITGSATIPFTYNFFYWKFDRLTAWDFTARLINEIRIREKSSAPPPAVQT